MRNNLYDLEAQSLWTNEDPRLHLLSWESEAGAPLLLTHGMAGNAHWWDLCAPLLAEAYRPAALDFSGHGDSEWLKEGRYDMEVLIGNIETARQSLGWDKMVICAHSMGARVAFDYVHRHPERVKALVAIDFLPEVFSPGSARFARTRTRRQPTYPDAEIMMNRFHLEPDGTLLDGPALREVARNSLRKVEGRFSWKFDWRCFTFGFDPVWPILSQIKVPTLVVRGEHSTVLSREGFERVVRETPGAVGVEISRSHHHVPLDCPRELTAEITGFLQKL